MGCTGGGSNFAGITFPYLGENLQGKSQVRVVAVEPAACPSLTKGSYTYDFGDTAHLTPLVKMHTLGSTFVPPGIHAGGLRYHGMAPLVSLLLRTGHLRSDFRASAGGIPGGRAVCPRRRHPAGARGQPCGGRGHATRRSAAAKKA